MSDLLEDHLLRQVDHAHRFFWHRARWRAVRTYFPGTQPFEVVDVGAGAGILATYLQRHRPLGRYRFVEPLPSLREFLRDRYGSAADAGDEERYSSSDFVTLLDVLEHQEDDQAFMAELVHKMRPGSTLLLTVPAGERYWSEWDVSLGHYRRYDRQRLMGCLDDLPVSVREVSYLFPELIPLAMFRARRNSASRKSAERSPAIRQPGDVSGSERAAERGPHGGMGANEAVGELASFPELPRPVNEVLAVASSCSVALRRFWPGGTSMFLAATVRGPG